MRLTALILLTCWAAPKVVWAEGTEEAIVRECARILMEETEDPVRFDGKKLINWFDDLKEKGPRFATAMEANPTRFTRSVVAALLSYNTPRSIQKAGSMLSVYPSSWPDLAFVAKLYEQNGDGEARRSLVDFMRVGDTAQDRRIVILLMARELGTGEPIAYSRARFVGRKLLIPHPIKEDPPAVAVQIDRELDGLIGEKVLKEREADSIRIFARTPRSVGVLLARWSRQAIPKARGADDDEWFHYFCDMVFLARSRAPEAFPLFLRGLAFKESDCWSAIELDILGGYTDVDPAKVDWDKWYQEWKAKGEDKLPEWRVPPPGGRRRPVGSAKKSVDTEGGKKAE